MSKTLEEIDKSLMSWMSKQHIFFVGSAPLSAEGHVNISPKGGRAFRVMGPHEVAYQDYTGSGAETVAHLRENGRMVIMFCSFKGPPRIVRLHGMGSVILKDSPDYPKYAAHFPDHPGARAIIRLQVKRISSSCGFSLPILEFRKDREILDDWSRKQGPGKVAAYRARKNKRSIDGLPAFDG